MELAKKTRLEQRAVIGLLVLFLATTWGALRNMGWFRPRVLQSVTVPLRAAASSVSAPVPAAVRDPSVEAASVALSEPAPGTAMAGRTYTAQHVRDPFRSLLPAAPVEEASGAAANTMEPGEFSREPPAFTPPTFTVQGLWWGGPRPRAIIDGDVYAVGDLIAGATITAITRDGVTVDLHGTLVRVTMAPESSASAAPSNTSYPHRR